MGIALLAKANLAWLKFGDGTYYITEQTPYENTTTARVMTAFGRGFKAITSGGAFEQWDTKGDGQYYITESLTPGFGAAQRGICTDSRVFYSNEGASFNVLDQNGNIMRNIAFAAGGNFGFEFVRHGTERFLYTVNRVSALLRKWDLNGNLIEAFSVATLPVDVTICGRYLFTYHDDPVGVGSSRVINQYDHQGNLIQSFGSVPPLGTALADAGSITNLGSHMMIVYREPGV